MDRTRRLRRDEAHVDTELGPRREDATVRLVRRRADHERASKGRNHALIVDSTAAQDIVSDSERRVANYGRTDSAAETPSVTGGF
jgi:hypothetical protein